MIKLTESLYVGVDEAGAVTLFDMTQGTRLFIDSRDARRVRKFLKNPQKKIRKYEELSIEDQQDVHDKTDKDEALDAKADRDYEDQVIHDRTLS